MQRRPVGQYRALQPAVADHVPHAGSQHGSELSDLVQAAFLKRPSSEWIAAFQAAGVPTGPIKTVAEVLDEDPHVRAREMVVEVEHPVVGRMKTLGVPIKLSSTPGGVTRAAPLLGQHTDEILAEVGYSVDEIAALRAAKAI